MKRGVGLLAMVSCNSAPRIVPLTERDCPAGATLTGAAPPAGEVQRCELPGGVRHGKSRAWFENGRLRYETEWWQGKKHGTFTLWHANGQKRAEGEDRHGVPVGTWMNWAENGTVTQERVFAAEVRAPAFAGAILGGGSDEPALGPVRSVGRGAKPALPQR